MVKTKIVKAAGRFGVRYGQYIKRKIADIESKQRKKQVCPFCGKRIIRLSKGIWKCNRCDKKFAGHAYYIEKDSMKIKAEKPLKKQESIINKEELKQKKKKTAPKTKKIKEQQPKK